REEEQQEERTERPGELQLVGGGVGEVLRCSGGGHAIAAYSAGSLSAVAGREWGEGHSLTAGSSKLPLTRPPSLARQRVSRSSNLDLAVEPLDPGRALLVDLLPVLEHELVLH